MKRKTVALCILTFNNEHTIGEAIKSALALTDEVIVVDLGSRDNCRIIAEGYGARVINFDFDDDYAAARNIALGEATSEWVLWLEPNEMLAPIRPVLFQRLIQDPNAGGYKVNVFAKGNREPVHSTETLRLYRRHPEVLYRYPIRERVEYSFLRAQDIHGFGDIEEAKHLMIFRNTEARGAYKKDGYILAALKRAVLEHPADPYPEYALAYEYMKKVDEEIVFDRNLPIIINALEGALQKAQTSKVRLSHMDDYMPHLIRDLSACYLAAGHTSKSWHMIIRVQNLCSEDDSIAVQYLAAGISYLRYNTREISPDELDCLFCEMRELIEYLSKEEVSSVSILRFMGELALFKGHVDSAKTCFRSAIDMAPDNSQAWLGLAQCELYLGRKSEAMRFYVMAISKSEYNCRAWSQGSDLLREIGFQNNAIFWQDTVTKKFPGFLKSEEEQN